MAGWEIARRILAVIHKVTRLLVPLANRTGCGETRERAAETGGSILVVMITARRAFKAATVDSDPLLDQGLVCFLHRKRDVGGRLGHLH